MKTKREVLEANGWTCIVGYQFYYEKTPDQSCVIISKEEIEEFLKKEPSSFFIDPMNHEYSYDEESAWELLFEDSNDDIDDFEAWTDKMLE